MNHDQYKKSDPNPQEWDEKTNLSELTQYFQAELLEAYHLEECIKQSSSWKITQPLRYFVLLCQSFKDYILFKTQMVHANFECDWTNSSRAIRKKIMTDWYRLYQAQGLKPKFSDWEKESYRDWINHHEPKLPNPKLPNPKNDVIERHVHWVLMFDVTRRDWIYMAIQAIERQIGHGCTLWVLLNDSQEKKPQNDEGDHELPVNAMQNGEAIHHLKLQAPEQVKLVTYECFLKAMQEVAEHDKEWVGVVKKSLLPAAQATTRLLSELNETANPRNVIYEPWLVYADEDCLNDQDERYQPWFKSAFNPELLNQQDYISSASWIRLDQFLKHIASHGVNPNTYWERIYNLAKSMPPQRVGHLPWILFHRLNSKEIPSEQTYAMIKNEILEMDPFSKGSQGSFQKNSNSIFNNTPSVPNEVFGKNSYELSPEDTDIAYPLVSIIIPTRNAADLIQSCVMSIKALTTYPNYEILILDNGSDDSEALALFAHWSKDFGIKVIRDDAPFNYSRLNNHGARVAQGDFLLLLNNDTEVISPDWIDSLLYLARKPQAGAIGASLFYPNHRWQHAGITMGFDKLAGHAILGLPEQVKGYFDRARFSQNVSAVTGACLMVARDKYWRVGGLNEKYLAVTYNDIDLCLKLRSLGYLNTWCAEAKLWHKESATRGNDVSPTKRARMEIERLYMLIKWKGCTQSDFYYNPNLCYSRPDFRLAWPPRPRHMRIGHPNL